MDTRIEIFRDDLWRQLRLQNDKVIKYNALINRIGKVDSREISHTNTFSLPSVFQNTEALGLNIFNPSQMAQTLNSKFPAKYYIEGKLLQQGFLIINNTISGTINVNFIDEALDITEKWGSTTFNELLTSPSITRPADYQTAIDEMTDYDMDQSSVLVPLSQVGTRGYNLSEFPNNLNAIGDQFQSYASGTRPTDYFNPYQSRPIFNAKALFDLAAESFGYTADFSPSVDWDLVEKTFMVEKGLSESQKEEGGLISTTYPTVSSNSEHYSVEGPTDRWNLDTLFTYTPGQDNTRLPASIPGWTNPPNFHNGYDLKTGIFIPDISESDSGQVTWNCTIDPFYSSFVKDWQIFTVWDDLTDSGNNVLFKVLPAAVGGNLNTSSVIDYTVDKTQFTNPPINGGTFYGVIAQYQIEGANTTTPYLDLLNMSITETLVPPEVIAYDEFGQYVSNTISLTHAAPSKTIKDLLSSYMQKDGILMNINSLTKVIKFFSYGHYQDQKDAGNFSDWSRFYRKYDSPLYNTDYGTSYAKRNQIGLTEPYTGNSFILSLTNQGADSKYKDFGTNLVKNFKDISSILRIDNTTVYHEYKNLGLGLVESEADLTGLTQARANGSTQGAITALTALANVNYLSLPPGVIEWYRLVDGAVKAEATFLLPVNVIRELDLSEPVYVEDLGGFYIIEEVAEYINAQTQVRVKLIKLIDDLSAL